MTMLEAHVDPQQWARLETEYRTGIESPEPGMVGTYLAHSSADPAWWRIMTFWSSREALELMRKSVKTPRGVEMFRAAGAAPVLSIFDVVAERGA